MHVLHIMPHKPTRKWFIINYIKTADGPEWFLKPTNLPEMSNIGVEWVLFSFAVGIQSKGTVVEH